MKFTLARHKEMLENARQHARDETERANRYAETAGRRRTAVEFYAKQIAEAEKRGMDGFDPDKFMKKCKP